MNDWTIFSSTIIICSLDKFWWNTQYFFNMSIIKIKHLGVCENLAPGIDSRDRTNTGLACTPVRNRSASSPFSSPAGMAQLGKVRSEWKLSNLTPGRSRIKSEWELTLGRFKVRPWSAPCWEPPRLKGWNDTDLWWFEKGDQRSTTE